MKRAEAVDELKRVYAVLNSDLKEARAELLQSSTEFRKRTLVRTCFALVEGLSHQLRQVTLATLQDTNFLSAGDLAILKEERYQLSAQGNTEERDNHQLTLPMLLFSLRIYAKNHGAEFTPKISDYGWNCLRKGFQMRDRLMHPKSLRDLAVTDVEQNDFAVGIKWWNDSLRDLLATCNMADNNMLSGTDAREAVIGQPNLLE